MQKWCPDAFAEAASPAADPPPARPPARDFTSLVPEHHMPDQAPEFASDPTLTGPRSLWELLSEGEKKALRTEARQALDDEFARRAADAAAELKTERDSLHQEFVTRLTAWTEEFTVALRRDEQELARQAAQLALAAARKIIRDTVEVDPGLVVRSLETALYKVTEASLLTVNLHPDDVPLLEQDDRLRARLRIERIVPDRRVDRGGCRIRAGAREWDATLTGQMDALAAVVAEAMNQDGTTDATPGDDDDLLG